MDLIMGIMQLCGINGEPGWHNSCNLNMHEGSHHSADWHADGEVMSGGAKEPTRIISLLCAGRSPNGIARYLVDSFGGGV